MQRIDLVLSLPLYFLLGSCGGHAHDHDHTHDSTHNGANDGANDGAHDGANDEPDKARAWLSYAEALAASYSRFEEGPAVLTKTTVKAGDNQDLKTTIANCHLSNGRFVEAEALLKRVINDDVNAQRSPMLHVWLGYVVRAQGRDAEATTHCLIALAAYDRLVENGSGTESITYRSISAFVLQVMGKTEAAAATYDALCPPDMPPPNYVYDHANYLPNSYQRIERLA